MPRKKGTVSLSPSIPDPLTFVTTEQCLNNITSIESNNENKPTSDKPPIQKKRGRRPKGGKIITTEKNLNAPPVTMQENIILHLRCSLDDIGESGSAIGSMTNFKYNPDIESVMAYSLQNTYGNSTQTSSLNYHELNTQTKQTDNCLQSSELEEECTDLHETDSSFFTDIECNNQEPETSDMGNNDSYGKHMSIINAKLHHLSKELHTDDIRHKKSACFWCTYDFDSEVIHIPKFNMSGRYHVYGCFCSPQCATAHLMSEKVDSSIKFERYQLLNNLYAGVYDYTSSIKPAPNPYYVLEKYYGSLSIEEYRDLMNTNRQMVVIDKPMTHVFPELYEDNDEFIVSKRTIPKNNSIYSVRKSSALKKT